MPFKGFHFDFSRRVVSSWQGKFCKYLKSSKLYYVLDNNNKNRDNRMDFVVR